MKHRLMLLSLMLVALWMSCPALCGQDSATRPDIVITVPESPDPVPCVVICPGRGYHKDLPLVKDLAGRLNREGFATVCFNWSFFTNGTQPSSDCSAEFADIEAAIRTAKTAPGVDSTRITLAGKSLGSVLGYYAFHRHPELRACLLLTPVIPEPGLGPKYYPGLSDESRPVTFILGDQDSSNCALGTLYDYLDEIGRPVPVVVLTGGHAFETGEDFNDPANVRNTQTAIEMSVYWLKRM